MVAIIFSCKHIAFECVHAAPILHMTDMIFSMNELPIHPNPSGHAFDAARACFLTGGFRFFGRDTSWNAIGCQEEHRL